MSLTIQQKIIAPLAISFSMVTAACIMSGSPEPAEAKARAEVTEAAVPLSGELPSLAPMLKHAMPAVVNISVTMTQRVGATPFGPFMEDPMFRRFFGILLLQLLLQRLALPLAEVLRVSIVIIKCPRLNQLCPQLVHQRLKLLPVFLDKV